MRLSRPHNGKALDIHGNRLAALMELGLLLGRGDGGFNGDEQACFGVGELA